MRNENVYYQQGDVILRPINKLPDNLVELIGEKVVQHGEVTGHRHQFTSEGAETTIYLDKKVAENTPDGAFISEAAGMGRITPALGKFVLIRAKDGYDYATLRHEEHAPIQVPPGIYEVDIVREFDYDSMETSRVLD